MDNAKMLSTWAEAGVEDFYLGFELEDRWHKQSLFYCHQGLEKICKTYYIGKSSKQWMGQRSKELALKTIDQIAKWLGHDIARFIKCMQSRSILPSYHPAPPYSEDDLLDALHTVYIEARYPVPQPFYRTKGQDGKERFRISSDKFKIYHDLLSETAPRDYARSMARTLLKRIEDEYSVKTSYSQFSNKISHQDWERFTNVFYGR